MTLKRAVKRFGWAVMDHSGCKVCYAQPGDKGWAELYQLSDYAVSTVGAGVVWLVQK